MTHSLLVALLASLLFTGCGPTPAAPTSIVPSAPSTPTVTPMLTTTVSPTPFHVGAPGEIHYEVTGVSALASVAYSSTDGATAIGATIAPAPATGVLRLTYWRPGDFTATLTATTSNGAALQANIVVNVIE
jgi:hypothetical protein